MASSSHLLPLHHAAWKKCVNVPTGKHLPQIPARLKEAMPLRLLYMLSRGVTKESVGPEEARNGGSP